MQGREVENAEEKEEGGKEGGCSSFCLYGIRVLLFFTFSFCFSFCGFCAMVRQAGFEPALQARQA
jgi:hypothetical protein